MAQNGQNRLATLEYALKAVYAKLGIDGRLSVGLALDQDAADVRYVTMIYHGHQIPLSPLRLADGDASALVAEVAFDCADRAREGLIMEFRRLADTLEAGRPS